MKKTMEKPAREKRIEAFKTFRENAKETFNSFRDESPSFQKFDDAYILNVCPKGRNGGTNEKLCEVFYGWRIYDQERTLDNGFNVSIRNLFETGATLAFSLLDDGYVLVVLHLPYTEGMKPRISKVVMDLHLDPRKLTQRRLKIYWELFNLGMEMYSLTGDPKWNQEVYWICWVFFKQIVKDDYLQERGCYKLVKTLANYVLSVGLSGFLIYLFTIAPQNKDQSRVEHLLERLIEQAEDRNQKLDAILSREGSKATTRDSVLRDSIQRRTP